ncbi:MAG TPA: hypothetical protein VF458_02735 [Ktedonobacteraceae bacterium]
MSTLFVPLAAIVLPQFLVVESLDLLNTRTGVILAFSGATSALYVLLFANFFKGVPEELFLERCHPDQGNNESAGTMGQENVYVYLEACLVERGRKHQGD